MPPVYATYNPSFAGDVIQQAKPRVYPYPASHTYTAGPSGHRLQPSERGNFFLRQNAPAQPLSAVNVPGGNMDDSPDTNNASCGCGCSGKK